jgi:hypothetical protein
MKLLTVLLTVVLLTGCSAFSKFDQAEYNLLNTITASAEVTKEQCGNKEKLISYVDSLYMTTVQFKHYVHHFPNNTYLHTPSEKMVEMTKELQAGVKDSTMSVKYCEIKLDVIKTLSSSTQQVAASKGK